MVLCPAASQRDLPALVGYAKLGQSSERGRGQGSAREYRWYVTSLHIQLQRFTISLPGSAYKKKVRRLVRRSAEEAFD